MKTITLIIAVSLLLISCKKDKITYNLTFSASHWVDEENQFCKPSAYYHWYVEDEDEVPKYDKNGTIRNTTVTGSTTAQTGDWIYIYISVNDVYDNGSVSCKSDDGTIYLFRQTDNLYIDEGDSETAKSSKIVRECKFQIK